MALEEKGSYALVLAGGGVSGVAWEIGILTALARAGIDFNKATLVVGTSAGSVVGAMLTSGVSLEEFYANQLVPVAQTREQAVDFDVNHFQQMIMTQVMAHGSDAQAVRAGIGAQALAATTPPEAERLAIIESRLPVQAWPNRKLLITAVDAESGEFVVFSRERGVGLVQAVAASCAVPLVWPTVTIGGRRYMDGGMRSVSNADLATGYERVLVLVPFLQPDDVPPVLGSNLAVEKRALEESGSQVTVISGDAAALKAMGANVLDPANRLNSAQAGLAQGERIAQAITQAW